MALITVLEMMPARFDELRLTLLRLESCLRRMADSVSCARGTRLAVNCLERAISTISDRL